MRNRKGFTLIELLVVVAIIAILAAILFPVFARAKARAKMGTCLSNCRQVGLAFLMYLSENDDLMPCMDSVWATNLRNYTNGAASDGGGTIWAGDNKARDAGQSLDYFYKNSILACIGGYMKNSSIWWCPDYKNRNLKPGLPTGSSTVTSAGDGYWTYYPYNFRLLCNFATNWQTSLATSGWPSGTGTLRDKWAKTVVPSTKTLPTSLGGFGTVHASTDYPKPEKTMIFWEKLPLHDLRRLLTPTYGYVIDPGSSKPCSFLDGHASVIKAGLVCFDDSNNGVVAWPYRSQSLGTFFSPFLPRNPNDMAEIGFSDFIATGWDID